MRLTNLATQTGLDEVARFPEWADLLGILEAVPARVVLAGIVWHLRVGGTW